MLDGRHVSSDVAVLDGKPGWWRHATGQPGAEGTFDHWMLHAEHDAGDRDARCGAWIAQHLAGYTGMLNLETIGGRIIEVHLRFADQWPDLYGKGWVEALVRLYRARSLGLSRHATGATATASCCSARTGRAIAIRRRALVDEVRAMPSVSSVQITFHEDRPPDQHAMPPGGFRLAIVNCYDLAQGRAAREKLRAFFLAS